MKLLINGYTVTENIKIKREMNDINVASMILDHVKRNKSMYAKLVLALALTLHYNTNYVFADVGASMDDTFLQLIDLLKAFAKYGCLGMGLKRLVEEMLSGASFKQASTAGISYWLCYIFIQFYPKLFDMVKM